MQKRLLLVFLTFVLAQASQAQCFEVLDGNGNFSATPQFVSCTPGNYTIFIQPDQNIGPYVIDWGDGSPNTNAASLTVGNNSSHTYNGATANYTLTITDNGSGCTVTGLVVLERNPLASIQLPAGDDNFGCTPIQFRFINSSTQVSENVVFVWDFGDGSPVETYNFTNQGDTITHTYLPGVGVQSCDLEVTLEASNFCGTSNASFFPLKVWDLDEAQITPSNDLLCYPDTVVQYTNATIRNCFPEGNQSQRFERWNFGDYWGLGRDSIIDWRPWNPPITPPPPIAYPGVGVYFVTLQDSSFCGIDDVTIAIEITDPPTAVITANRDTICEGEQVTFSNSSFGGQNRYRWNFDQGAGFETGLGGGNQTRTYNTAGNYDIELLVFINGALGCRDTSSVPLVVLPSPDADFTFDTNNECDSMQVNFTDASTGTISTYAWDFDNGNTFSGPNPPTQNYTTPGTYRIELTVSNSTGCSNTISRNIRVRSTPTADFTVSSVCLNQQANFIDQSISGGDPITDYKWYFGDGDSSSAQDPSHLYTAFGTYTVTQIVDNGFCQDTTTLDVIVENEPTAAFSADTLEGCSRLTVNFTNASSANATNFRWNFGDGSAIVQARDTFHTFTNTSERDTTFIVQLIARTAFGCADTTYDSVRVFPVPTPSFTSDAVVDCGPVEVNFTNTTVGDSLDFFWNFGDGSPIVNDTNPSHIFENKTLFVNRYEVALVVLSKTGCTDTTTQIVEINPEPIFDFTAVPDSGCSPLVVRFPSVVGAVQYRWEFGDGGTATGATPTHTYINNTTNNQVYNVRLIAQNSFNCADTSFGTVLVYPNPTSAFTLDTNKGCQPLPISITNNSTGANFFNWSFGDGTTSNTADANFIKTYTNPNSATRFNTLQLITETIDGCRDTSSQIIEVHPFVEAQFVANPDTGCSPLSVVFQNQSQGAASSQWQFGDGTLSAQSDPTKIYTNPTLVDQNYRARLTVSSNEGCISEDSTNILVYPKPTARFSISDSVGCQPLNVVFTNTSTLRDNCSWSFGDGTTSSACSPTVSKTFTNATSFFPIDYVTELTITTSNGCLDNTRDTITVFPRITADFAISDTAGCSPLTTQFQDRSVGAQNYFWTFSDGQGSGNQNTVNVFTNPSDQRDSTFEAKLLVTAEYQSGRYTCSDSLTKTIEVFAKPVARFTIDTNRSCNPFPVTITNSSSAIGDSCFWNFGDGNILTDSCFTTYQKTFTNTQSSLPLNRTIFLEVFTDNGCSDSKDTVVTINPDIQADFSRSDTAGCSPLAVQFQNQSTGVQNYSWTFDNGQSSNTANSSTLFTNIREQDSTYEVKLFVSSFEGCVDSITKNVEVFAKPVARFTIDTNRSCNPFPVTITNSSSAIGDSCFWNFGDGNILTDSCFTTYQKTFTNTQSSLPLNRTIFLEVFTDNGCSDSKDTVVTINPDIQADFSRSDTAGCSPLAVQFQNQSTGVQNYSWTFDNGQSSNTANSSTLFTNIREQDSTYEVKLFVSSFEGCVDSITKNVEVFAKPIARFTIDTNRSCNPFPVTITNSSSLISDSCYWNFGDGNTLLNDCFTTYQKNYTNTQSSIPLNRRILLEVYTDKGCTDTQDTTVTINPEVTANFSAPDTACSPFKVDFLNLSSGGQSYDWDFGDGGLSTTFNTSNIYSYTGNSNDTTYEVRLTVTSFENCVAVKDTDIVIYPKPNAAFTVDATEGCHPFAVNVTNSSELAQNCAWNFGDGFQLADSCFTQPYSKTYTNDQSSIPLNRTIQLIVNSNEGCLDTAFQAITVNPKIEADFDSVAFGCSPLAVSFQNQSTGVDNNGYTWTFGDGGSNVIRNPQHTFVNFGLNDTTFQIKLKVESPYQCLDSLTQDVEVYPKPTADFAMSTNQGCQPLIVDFTNNSTLTGTCNWTYGDGNDLTDCAVQTSHTYFNQLSLVPLNYQAKLEVISNRGCVDELTRIVTVNPEVTADFTAPDTACSPLDAEFRSQSFGAISNEWTFGDGRVGRGMIVNNRYENTSGVLESYTVRLTATSLEGCEDVAEKTVYVRPTPEPDFTPSPLTQLFPASTVNLANTTFAKNNWDYVWDFKDTSTSTLVDPGSHTYSYWGQYNIQLKASSPFCSDSVSKLVEIEVPFPVADFDDSISGCQPLEVTFNNKSLYGRTFLWDFGDGNTSNAENPSHIYFDDGDYNVTLQVTGFEPNKQDDTVKFEYVKVFKSPNADFITNKDKVFVPNDPLVFSNRSFNADNFLWNFGDGNTSTERSPTYQYTEPGEYQVYLIASSTDGCIDTAFAPSEVIAELEGRLDVPNAFTPNPRGGNGGRVNINPGAGEFNDVFYAKVSGTSKYELNIFNKWGELLFVSKDINIGWDGYYRDELCKQDVYVWKITAEFVDGTSVVKVGDLMLLR